MILPRHIGTLEVKRRVFTLVLGLISAIQNAGQCLFHVLNEVSSRAVHVAAEMARKRNGKQDDSSETTPDTA